jgi:secreted trypsin-like serine protease
MNRFSRTSAMVLLALAACSDGDVAGGEDDLKGGIVAREAIYAPVGALGYVTDTGFSVSCTGTLVAPTWVITAKHCVTTDAEGSAMDRITQNFMFVPGWQAATAKKRYAVKAAAVSNLSEGGFIEYGNDVALIELAEAPTEIRPAEVRSSSLAKSDLGARRAVVGFGFDERDKNGIRKRGRVTIRSVNGRALSGVFESRTLLDALVVRAEGSSAALARDDDRSGQIARFFDHVLAQDHESFVGLGNGDAQPCRSDSGAPVLSTEGAGAAARLRVHAVISGSLKLSSSPCGNYGAFVGTFGPSSQELFRAHGIVAVDASK